MKVKFLLVCVTTLLFISGSALAQNVAPVLDPIGDKTVDENSFWQLAVHATDGNPGDALTMSADISALPSSAYAIDAGNGVLTIYWDITYDDAATYSITVTANDGTATDQETFDLIVNNINRLPLLDPVGPQTAVQTVALDINLSATDADTNALTITMTSDSTEITASATFTDNGDGTADFSWTPTMGLQGNVYPVVFTVDDGIDQVSETVMITVDGLPVFTNLADTSVFFTEVLALDVMTTDADGDIPVLEMTDQAGSITLPPAAVFTDNGNGTGVLDWATVEADTGTYTLDFSAIDNGVAPPDTVVKRVMLTVQAYNRLPVITPVGDFSVAQGDTLVIPLAATDADNDDLSFAVNPVPHLSSIVNNGNGTGEFIWTPDFSKASYQQSLTFYVVDSLLPDTTFDTINVNNIDTIVVVDPGAGMDSTKSTITVTIVANQAPALSAIGTQVAIEASLFNLTVNATDPNGTIPELYILNGPSGAAFTDNNDGSGDFSWTPGAGDVGNNFVTFFATDGSLIDSEVVKIVVNPAANSVPVITVMPDTAFSEGLSYSGMISATDADGTIPTIMAINAPPGATLTDHGNGTATFSWMPSYKQAGIYDISFEATDGTASDTGTTRFTIIEAGNQLPILSGGGPYSVNEGQLLSFKVTGRDPEGGRLIYLATGLPAGATLTDYGNDTAFFSWTPSYCQQSVNQIRIRARVTTDTGSVTIPVSVNDMGDQPPVLNPISGKAFTLKVANQYTDSTIYSDIDTITVMEGDSLRITPSAQLFPDCPRPPLGTSVLPSGAVFTSSNGSGVMRWVIGYTQGDHPTESFMLYTMIFFADDPVLQVATDTIYIKVMDAGNQTPTIDPLAVTSYNVAGDKNVLIQFNLITRDLDSTISTLTTSPLPGAASFTDNGDNTGFFSWTPVSSDAGTHQIFFFATDPLLAADTVSINVTVSAGSGRFRVDSVSNSPAAGQIYACNEISFHMSANNNTGSQYDVTTNAFRIYSPGPEPATWTDLTADLSSSQLTGPNAVLRKGATPGAGADTVRFVSSAMLAGFDGRAWTLKVGPIGPEFIGKQICIDTVSFISTNTWVWSDIFGLGDGVQPPVRQVWDNPICFDIVEDLTNNPPVIEPISMLNDTSVVECSTLVLTMSAGDVDGDTPVFSASDLPAGASFVPGDSSGTFTWTPTGLDASGTGTTYTVTFSVTDGCATVDEVVNITVTPEPAPDLATIANMTVPACEESSIGLAVNSPGGPPLDAGAFTVEVVSADTSAPTPLVGTMVIDHSAGSNSATFRVDPDNLDIGDHLLRFTVVDADCGSIDSQTVSLTVTTAQPPTIQSYDPVTDAPKETFSVIECEPVQITLKGVDPNGLTLTWSTPGRDNFGVFAGPTGDSTVWTWNQGSGFADEYDIRFRATNECGGTGDTVVHISILPNQEPIVNLNTFNSRKGLETGDTTYYVRGDTVVVTMITTDPEDSSMVLTMLDSLPTGASFIDNGNGIGVFTFYSDQAPKGVYELFFKAEDGCGFTNSSITVIDTAMMGSTGIYADGEKFLPEVYDLQQNYPNPFNPTTTITMDIPKASRVSLDLFNVLGQRIRRLVDQDLSPGRYHIAWDGTNESGNSVATGIYFYRIEAADYTQTKKMLLMK
ncbi:MAG: T9SS type A sorting domain-containing protein [bacterium]|nr:T9SS type A sorting domain-containing protein [bacterium]